jgi:hypothetical protein
MITDAEYDVLQDILNGRSHSLTKKHEYFFSGLVKCGYCGGSIIGENHIKKSGLEFSYARCTKRSKTNDCPQRPLSARKLEGQVIDYLGTIQLHPKFFEWAKKWLTAAENQDRTQRNLQYQQLKDEFDGSNRLIEFLTDKWLSNSGVLTDEEYKSQKQRLLQKKEATYKQMLTLDKNLASWTDLAIEIFRFCSDATNHWLTGTIDDKKAILRMIGVNLQLKDNKLNITGRNVFNLIQRSDYVVNKNNTGENPLNEAKLRDNFALSPVLGR